MNVHEGALRTGEIVRRKPLIGKIAYRTGLVVLAMTALTACAPEQKATSTPTQPAIGCPTDTKGVVLFDLRDFKGESLRLVKGTNDLGPFAHRASSICNPEGNTVRLWDNRRPSVYNQSVDQLQGVDNNSADTAEVESK